MVRLIQGCLVAAVLTLLIVVLALGMSLPGARAQAATPTDHQLLLEAGSGKVIRTARAIANLFAADPKIAEVRPASPTSIFVFGVAIGRTTVAAFDEAGEMIAQYDVIVRPSAFASGEAQRQAKEALPNSDVTYQTTPAGISLSGRVATPEEADRAVTIGKNYISEKQSIDNRLAVGESVQVNLRVRIAEISREITRQLGINWSALGKIGSLGIFGALPDTVSIANQPPFSFGVNSFNNHTVNAMLDLLAEDGLITILAEPNLTARSGETASFLAGGEFPVPVAEQNNTISVAFKQYGVSLAFVPTVMSAERISIRVRPEVSELTSNGAVSVPLANGATVTIPGLNVRRAETTVELGSGQSFAIAGLLQRNNTLQSNGLPYLGETPVLGQLFKSDLFQRNETELVIVVTPYLVRPVSVANALKIPTDSYVPPNDYDRALLVRQRARGTSPDGNGQVPGDAGFLLN
jgi:pilus assembly protein CpaC